MKNELKDSARQPVADKKGYHTPALITHGSVEKLTQHDSKLPCYSDLGKKSGFWW